MNFSTIIAAPRMRRCCNRSALPDRRPRHSALFRHRGRSFHDNRIAAPATSRLSPPDRMARRLEPVRGGVDRHETRLHCRLADHSFALAAHPWLLAEAPRHRRRLCPPARRAEGRRSVSSANLAAHGYVGCNVTIPHKETAFRAAARPTARRKASARPTRSGSRTACSALRTPTFTAFFDNLDEQTPGWDQIGLPAAILGAGGAARGIIRGLMDRGFQHIRLANRTRERAEALAASFGPAVSVFAWEDRTAMLTSCGLLVNTTTLGMDGHPPLEIDLVRLLPSRRRQRHRLYAARNRAAAPCALAGLHTAGRSWYAAASGGAGLREMVRRPAGGDAGAARPGRWPISNGARMTC